MNDYENRLKEALTQATSDYRPADPHEAKQIFMARSRRRRIAFYAGSAALAGAAIAIVIALLPGGLTRQADGTLPPATGLAPAELSDVEVGAAPTGIGFGNDSVWVANSADGTVKVIDPLTNEVAKTFRVGGTPDDVAIGLGAAWVSDSESGVVTKLPFEGAEQVRLEIGAPGAGLDVAPGAGAVWVVSQGDSLYRIDPSTSTVSDTMVDIEGMVDVAAGQGTVVVLGSEALVEVDPTSYGYEEIAKVDDSEHRELQMSEGAVWIADGAAGEVTRFDLDTGESSDPVFVGGEFTAIASGEDSIWLISGNAGDDGNLVRVDPVTARLMGGRARLGGRPVDVTTGAGSVWIVNVDGNSVTRIDPNALPDE